MPDDRVKISALDSASTMDTGDMFPVTQERNGVKKTNKAFMSQIASEVVNGIEYTTALDTDDKKPIGAINELLNRIISLYPVKSFSPTPLATLPDSANNVPMKSLTVNILPQQAGSGTPSPSNPRTISGVSSVTVTQTDEDEQTIATHTINLGTTVDGGVCDVTGGQGKNSYNKVKLNTLNWTKDTSIFDFPVFVTSISGRRQGDLYAVCEVFKCLTGERTQLVTQDNAITKRYSSSTGESIVLRCDSYSTVEDLMQAVGDYYIAYELATPTPITTTPTTIKTMGGTESIFADCGDVEGEYRADIQAYIDGLVNNGNRSVPNLSKSAPEEEPKKEEEEPEKEEQEEKK